MFLLTQILSRQSSQRLIIHKQILWQVDITDGLRVDEGGMHMSIYDVKSIYLKKQLWTSSKDTIPSQAIEHRNWASRTEVIPAGLCKSARLATFFPQNSVHICSFQYGARKGKQITRRFHLEMTYSRRHSNVARFLKVSLLSRLVKLVTSFLISSAA